MLSTNRVVLLSGAYGVLCLEIDPNFNIVNELF